ncbi:alpha/beta hydrolase [Streptomyces sp. Tu 3180]|uniref:alpha/beta fold hydrolase n=1 Tax=Streptomyces sp. Tu 3180 TaxID=2682611 RepID=UPI00135901AE|nr:alpha/beta hydrolase [Streptomyces sp. Tu 3180]KAF3469267.1 alpha/beta hydrolase [Streptomyces sp. Tu 3180]
MLIVPPLRVGEERLPDGRLLGWAEWGREDGTPVLLCPGAATSRHLGLDAAAVSDLGIRLISVDRPGLGSSTPAPRRTFADFAADIRTLANRRGLGRPAVIAHSQGAPFALACAAAGVVGASAVVSGADEVADPRFADVLPPRLRHLVDLCVDEPHRAEEIFAAFTAQTMWEMVLGGSPACDVAVYREESFAAAYLRALREGFAQGAGGYARDTVLAMGRWGIDLASIAVPVDVWYGAEDLSHSPDQGVGLTSRIPGAVRHLVPGVGGSVLWTHSHRIVRALLEHVERT